MACGSIRRDGNFPARQFLRLIAVVSGAIGGVSSAPIGPLTPGLPPLVNALTRRRFVASVDGRQRKPDGILGTFNVNKNHQTLYHAFRNI